ncbi:MAG TPA: hypothetical protein VGM27_01850 [Acidobacteriaceae bacterium]
MSSSRDASSHPLSDLGYLLVASHPLESLGFTSQRPLGAQAARAAKAAEENRELRPEIQLASNRVQPVGAIDPESRRVITQPSDNPAINQVLATEAMRTYRSGLHSAIRNISGAKLAASRDAKNPERLAEKIEQEGQPPETINDYGAAQISVDSPKARDAVVAAIRKRFPVVREQNNFDRGDPEYGYRSHSMQVQMPNGVSQELQIVPKEVFEINSAEHKDYKTARDAELAGRNADAIKRNARDLNDAAMTRFDARNSSSKLRKGAGITLADGTAATVSYLDPNMNIARIRTSNGKNLTVRLGQLRGCRVTT